MHDTHLTTATPDPRLDRAVGALVGLAVGDALGMPTQSLSREEICAQFGQVDGLHDAAPDQPIAPGMPAGSVTDDTEQAVIVAQLLLAGDGHVDAHDFAHALSTWQHHMVERGSQDLLGPSTNAAISALASGVAPEEAGRHGTTNGGAMRVTPVGVAVETGPRLLPTVVESCFVTHNTGLGISAAAVIAGAVSAGVDGADVAASLAAGIDLSRAGEKLGHWVAGASIPERFLALRPQTVALQGTDFSDYLYRVVGTSVQSQESVVSALLIADHYREDPWAGVCAAASLGGDTDTIAAMAGAILGASHGAAAFPRDVRQRISEVNHMDLETLAGRLLALRRPAPAVPTPPPASTPAP